MNEKTTAEELVDRYHEVALYKLSPDEGNRVYALKKAYQRKNILSQIQANFSTDMELAILELGPGMGCLAELVLNAYPKASYTIIDNNQGALDELQSRFHGINACLIENERQLASLSDKYDVIAAIDVWEHLPPKSLVSYTRWCYDSLKPNGLFILQFPNWGCPLTATTFCSDLTHVNQLNERTVQQLFALVGVPDQNYDVYNRKTPGALGAVRDYLMQVYCIYLRILHILFGTVRLKLFASDLVVVVRK